VSVIYRALRTIESDAGGPHARAGGSAGSLPRRLRGRGRRLLAAGLTAGVVAAALLDLQRPASWSRDALDGFRGLYIDARAALEAAPVAREAATAEPEDRAGPPRHALDLPPPAAPPPAAPGKTPARAPAADQLVAGPVIVARDPQAVSRDAARALAGLPVHRDGGIGMAARAAAVPQWSPPPQAALEVFFEPAEAAAGRSRRAVVQPDTGFGLRATSGARGVAPAADRAPVIATRRAPSAGAVLPDHTRRVRRLNAELGRAIQRRDRDEVARILAALQRLLDADSVYMLKVRAFTQLAIGEDIDTAMRLLREVLLREPGDRDAAVNMAVAEINLGETGAARRRLAGLAAAHPGDADIRRLLRSLE